MTAWFVAQTQPGKEDVAKTHLMQQAFGVFLPVFKKIVSHARQQKEVLRPLFPGYIFVQLNLEVDQWRRINGTRGVSALLTQENKPLAVPAAIIQNLIQQQETQGCVSLDSLALFKVGETVRLLDGAFEDHTATIVALSDKDRATILLHFMNRSLEVLVPFTSLERED